MWAQQRHDSAMDIPRQHTLDTAWTPPEIDESDSRHDYFNIYGTSPPRYPSETERRWLKESNRMPEQPSWVTDNFGFDSAIDLDPPPRPKPSARLTEPLPQTPTRPCYVDASQPRAEGAPRYPYTPDSSRMLRRSTELPSSPSPWDDFSEDSSSPIQNALSSCIAHFENLIQTRQPDEEQMEYIVGQFESMAAHLSAPEAQSKETDEELFADAEHDEEEVEEAEVHTESEVLAEEKLHHQAYVEEVGNYVAGVQKYILDLRMRMDEIKTLNSIQLDVINDLRKQMKIIRQSMREELEERPDEDMDATLADLTADANFGKKGQEERKGLAESWQTLVEEEDLSQEVCLEYSKLLRNTVEKLTSEPPSPSPSPTPNKRRVVTIVQRPPRGRSFWASLGEAVDAVSNMLLEE
jgi:hypothetical protein